MDSVRELPETSLRLLREAPAGETLPLHARLSSLKVGCFPLCVLYGHFLRNSRDAPGWSWIRPAQARTRVTSLFRLRSSGGAEVLRRYGAGKL